MCRRSSFGRSSSERGLDAAMMRGGDVTAMGYWVGRLDSIGRRYEMRMYRN